MRTQVVQRNERDTFLEGVRALRKDFAVLAAILLCGLFEQKVIAATVVIDSFETPFSSGVTYRSGVSGPGILGTERDVIVGTSGLTIGGGYAEFAPLAIGSTAFTLDYDGVGGVAYEGNRLLPVTDLTSGGANSALSLEVISVTGTWRLQASILSGTSGESYGFFVDPLTEGDVSRPGHLILPFSRILGSANPASANELIFSFGRLTPNGAITFGGISAVPEPSTTALFVLAAAVFLVFARRMVRKPFRHG